MSGIVIRYGLSFLIFWKFEQGIVQVNHKKFMGYTKMKMRSYADLTKQLLSKVIDRIVVKNEKLQQCTSNPD